MNTTSFKSVLFKVAKRMGLDPTRNLQQNVADALADSPVLFVEAGREQQWDLPVFKAWGCLALSGDNGFVTYGDGAVCATGGFWDKPRLLGGTLSVDTKYRQLVRADGSHLDWGTESASTSILTIGAADARYAPIGSTGGGTGGGSTIVFSGKGVAWMGYQSISNGGNITLSYPTVVLDPLGGWDATANTYTIQATGNYLIVANCSIYGISGGGWRTSLYVFINSTYQDLCGQVGNFTPPADQGPSLNGTQFQHLTAGDTVRIRAYLDGTAGKASGHALTIIKL